MSSLNAPLPCVQKSVNPSLSTGGVYQVGSGYTSVTVSVSGGGGSGAAVTGNIVGGQVTSYTITNNGSGYTSNPTITVSGNGSGAAAIGTVFVTSNLPNSNVSLPFGGFPGAALY